MEEAIFTIRVDDGAIVLEDLDQGRSVINDAERVIERLAAAGYDLAMPVIYRDTMGQWDLLHVADGQFSGYGSLGGAKTYTEARVALARKLEESRQ